MYKLEKVYGIISFEEKAIKLLVVEKNNSTHCLFYDEYISDSIGNDITLNTERFFPIINDMMKKADGFIGINIKRYIVNIGFISPRIVHGQTQKFDVEDGFISKQTKAKIINNVDFLDAQTGETCLKIQPTSWEIDGIKFDNIPEELKAKKIKMSYNAYVVNAKIFGIIKRLISSLKVSVIEYLCNELSFAGIIPFGSEKKIFNVLENNTKICFYDQNNVLFKISVIPIGLIQVLDKIKQILKISQDINIRPIINTLNNFTRAEYNPTLINIHLQEFLSLQEIRVRDIHKCCKMAVDWFMKELEFEISKIEIDNSFKNSEYYLNASSRLSNTVFTKENLSHEFSKKIKHINVDVVTLEDKKVNNLISAIDLIDAQNKLNIQPIYSIDPYTSSEVYDNQNWKDIGLKLGILTTKWSAKLG